MELQDRTRENSSRPQNVSNDSIPMPNRKDHFGNIHTECAQAEESEADILVQISVAIEGCFAVIQVKCTKVFHSHYVLEVVQCLSESHWASQIISRSVDVTCVKAYSNTFLVVYERDDVAQIFKGRTNYVSTTCHRFEDRRYGLGGCMGSVESLGYAGNGGRSGVAASPAGVKIVESDTKVFTTVEIVEEGIVGLGGLLSVFLGEIYQIGAVR